MFEWKALRIQTYGLFFWLLLGACSAALPMQGAAENRGADPKVLVPKDGQKIGEGDDPLCPPAKKYCNRLRAEGQVPTGYAPFFAVEPVLVSPKMWIQPVIHGVRQDGTFSGLIYLGEEDKGAKEYFKIYVVACKDAGRLHTGDEPMGPPEGCLLSEPVEVYRTR